MGWPSSWNYYLFNSISNSSVVGGPPSIQCQSERASTIIWNLSYFMRSLLKIITIGSLLPWLLSGLGRRKKNTIKCWNLKFSRFKLCPVFIRFGLNTIQLEVPMWNCLICGFFPNLSCVRGNLLKINSNYINHFYLTLDLTDDLFKAFRCTHLCIGASFKKIYVYLAKSMGF